MTEDEYTTISVKKETKEKIAKIGSMNDDWDTMLNRLADFWLRYKGVVKP